MRQSAKANPGERHQAQHQVESEWAGWTRIGLVVDRSGSMQKIVDEANGGLAHWLLTVQDAPGASRTSLDVCFFDTEFVWASYDTVGLCGGVVVEPRGMTALFDATAMMVSRLEGRLAAGDRALVIVMTDGLENASREYSVYADGMRRIKALLDDRESSGRWTVVFLANEIGAENAAVSAGRLGSTIRGATASGQMVTASLGQTATATASYMSSGVASRSEAAGLQGFYGDTSPGEKPAFPVAPKAKAKRASSQSRTPTPKA